MSTAKRSIFSSTGKFPKLYDTKATKREQNMNAFYFYGIYALFVFIHACCNGLK